MRFTSIKSMLFSPKFRVTKRTKIFWEIPCVNDIDFHVNQWMCWGIWWLMLKLCCLNLRTTLCPSKFVDTDLVIFFTNTPDIVQFWPSAYHCFINFCMWWWLQTHAVTKIAPSIETALRYWSRGKFKLVIVGFL